MYAIAFDLDIDVLKNTYENTNYTNAYNDIRKFLESNGFEWKQGSMYFGDIKLIDAVKCVITIQELTRKFKWFKASVRDIRMLRIEDNNDLMPAIERI